MKINFEKLDNTFVVGVAYSKNKTETSLIFDLGEYTLGFIKKNKSKKTR